MSYLSFIKIAQKISTKNVKIFWLIFSINNKWNI